MVVGILALQGGFALHQKKFESLGVQTRLVVSPEHLADIDGLIVPGGESSTMLKNATNELWDQLKIFSENHSIWGICAGSILLANRVENPEQRGLGVIDITVRRNAYGAQNESFIKQIEFRLSQEFMAECIFIRAPKIQNSGSLVNILATYGGDPIMVEQNSHIATTFHPELSKTTEFHEFFLEMICKK